jgi:ribosomal protein L14
MIFRVVSFSKFVVVIISKGHYNGRLHKKDLKIRVVCKKEKTKKNDGINLSFRSEFLVAYLSSTVYGSSCVRKRIKIFF